MDVDMWLGGRGGEGCAGLCDRYLVHVIDMGFLGRGAGQAALESDRRHRLRVIISQREVTASRIIPFPEKLRKARVCHILRI